jgi:iron complex outermembrane receptor protein
VQNRLYAGVALGQRESGGFLDNDFTGETDVNDEEDLNARFSLRATPSDSWDIHLTVDYNEADDAAGDPSYAYHEFYLSDSPPTPEDIGSGRVNLNSYGRTISQDFLGGFDREESTVVLNIEYDFEWATLTSITGKSNQETSIRASLSRLPVRVIDFDILWDIESLSQEFRLTSNGGGRTHWQVGAYYFDNSRERTAILDFLNGQGWQEFPSTLDEVQNKAIFGNVEYGITDSLSMRLGLRYDTEDRTQSIPSTGASLSADNDEMLWSVSLTYQPSDFMTLYSTISKGYHAGGPNALDAVALGAPESYEPEFLTNYEAGIKGTSPSNSFGYEIAVFFMDWEDQQLFTEFDVINSASRFIVNAGQSEVYGMEMSLRYQPSEQLSISGALSYLQTEYLEFVNEIDAPAFGLDPDLAGNILPYSPELSASMSIQHISPFGSTGWDVRARGDLAYVGERAFDATNLFIANSHTLLNLYLGLQNDRYEIGAFVDNLGDERYLTGGVVPSNGNPPLATIGDPRTWGVRFRMTF